MSDLSQDILNTLEDLHEGITALRRAQNAQAEEQRTQRRALELLLEDKDESAPIAINYTQDLVQITRSLEDLRGRVHNLVQRSPLVDGGAQFLKAIDAQMQGFKVQAKTDLEEAAKTIAEFTPAVRSAKSQARTLYFACALSFVFGLSLMFGIWKLQTHLAPDEAAWLHSSRGRAARTFSELNDIEAFVNCSFTKSKKLVVSSSDYPVCVLEQNTVWLVP